MRVGHGGLGAVLALCLMTSCGIDDIRRPASTPSAVVASEGASAPSGAATAAGTSTVAGSGSGSTPPATSTVRPDCAAEAQPRRLLATGDVWPMADLDAMSQIASQLSTSCDLGPSWPEDCDTLWEALAEGWPGYRTEGVYYTAAITMLNTAGKTVAEQVMLFRLPTSPGLAIVVKQARACHATASAAVSGAQVYRYPRQGNVQRVLVVDRMVAFNLTAPVDVDLDKLIALAVRRTR